MGLSDGKPTGQLFIDKNAALTCINHIREVVEAKTGESISTYALEKFMVNGDYDCSDVYRNIIQGELKQYAEQIYLILKKFGYNLDLTKIVFAGAVQQQSSISEKMKGRKFCFIRIFMKTQKAVKWRFARS